MEVLEPDTMRVHISGVEGMHPLRVGIAYWYRGHYLYGAALNPVEPQPFATKKKVLLNGVQRESAPIYSQTDEDLVPEIGRAHV